MPTVVIVNSVQSRLVVVIAMVKRLVAKVMIALIVNAKKLV